VLFRSNPRASQILGLQAYASVKDIPDPVDYAIITVRASLVPGLLRECVSKGVKVVHIYTGDFADGGKEEGRRLQKELVDVIKGSTTRVIGPNCMGVYCPSSGMTLHPTFSKEPGPVAIVSQTGAALIRLLPLAHARGLHFSKVVSYGNALDIDSPELLEYLADDPETKYVLAYIEGVQDGQRLLEATLKCNSKKPVILLKGGLTHAGARAISSHTATLVGTKHVWRAFFKQTKAIPVETFEEALDQVVAFRYLPPPAGRRVGIVGLGGGMAVVTSDICEREGLAVPQLAEETIRSLQALKGLAVGRGVRNPVETGLGKSGLFKDFADALRLVAADPQVDFLMIQLYPEGYVQFWSGGNQMDQAMDVLIGTVKSLPKPVVTVIGLGHDVHTVGITLKAHQQCYEAGLAAFTSPEAAARAVSKLIGYHEHRTS
jgi:acyl-CoA synthetase (NDP forming)